MLANRVRMGVNKQDGGIKFKVETDIDGIVSFEEGIIRLKTLSRFVLNSPIIYTTLDVGNNTKLVFKAQTILDFNFYYYPIINDSKMNLQNLHVSGEEGIFEVDLSSYKNTTISFKMEFGKASSGGFNGAEQILYGFELQ